MRKNSSRRKNQVFGKFCPLFLLAAILWDKGVNYRWHIVRLRIPHTHLAVLTPHSTPYILLYQVLTLCPYVCEVAKNVFCHKIISFLDNFVGLQLGVNIVTQGCWFSRRQRFPMKWFVFLSFCQNKHNTLWRTFGAGKISNLGWQCPP